MSITCPTCARPIATGDVNVQTMVAKCVGCGAVFPFDEQVHAASAGRNRGPQPSTWHRRVHDDDASTAQPVGAYRTAAPSASPGLEISRTWFSPSVLFLTVFVMFWDGFLVFWYATALGTGNLLMTVFPVPHVAIGAGLTYGVLAGYLNRTTVYADDERLTVRVGPLPWVNGDRSFGAQQLRHFRAGEAGGRSWLPMHGLQQQRGRSTFEVTADVGGLHRTVVSDLPSWAEARWVAETLADHYRVPVED